MWDMPDPSYDNVSLIICLTAIIVTAIICNTKTRISQQKYHYRQDIAPERFSYKLRKQAQKITLTAELYSPVTTSTGGQLESERIEAQSEDYPSTGA